MSVVCVTYVELNTDDITYMQYKTKNKRGKEAAYSQWKWLGPTQL